MLMNHDMRLLREKLNATLLIEPTTSEYVLELSEELDKLILEYYMQVR